MMIQWLVQSSSVHPDLKQGIPPAGLLSDTEQAYFFSLKSAKRRQDWLLGRWTAKHLVQATLYQSHRLMLPLATIEIQNDSDGAPRVSDFPAIQISISHAQGHAFCAVMMPSHQALGADIEVIATRSVQFVNDYFTTAEKQWLETVPVPYYDVAVNLIWSGKEAAFKVLRTGLRVDTRSVVCLFPTPFEIKDEWQPFGVTLEQQRYSQPIPTMVGWWRTYEGFVLTLATGCGQQEIGNQIGDMIL